MRKLKLTPKQINLMKEVRAWMILFALNLLWIIPCVYDATHKEPTEEVVEDTTEDIIHWKEEEVAIEEVESEEVTIEEVEVDAVTEPEEEEVKFFNVPLSEDLQMHIFRECEKYNIAPEIIIAMIEKESYYDANEVSSHDARGLMQVMPKWHKERMKRLGCTDLFDPYQNVTVGIDYVAELKEKNADLYWVLMAYNMGEKKATKNIKAEKYTKYAISIVERAGELAEEVE